MNSKFSVDMNPSIPPKSSVPSVPPETTTTPISYSHYQQPSIRPAYPTSATNYVPAPGYPSQVHEYPPTQQQYLSQQPYSHQYPPHPHAHQYYPQSSVRYPTVVSSSSASTGRIGDGKDDPNYTLTNLDSYSGSATSKTQTYLPAANYPPRPSPNYVPVSSPASGMPPQTSPIRSPPPKMLNLDSPRNPYPTSKQHPGPPHYYQSGHHAYDHNLVPQPHSDYYQSHHHAQQGGPPSHSYYGGPIHGSPLQRMPSHVGSTYRPQGPPPSSLNYISPRNVSPQQQTSLAYPLQPPTSNNSPQSTAIRPPPYPSSGHYPYSPHGYIPPNPTSYVHSHHPPYPVAASNGGFMIQNLLHNRPPAVATLPIPTAATTMTMTTASVAKPVCATKSIPKATKSTPKAKKSPSVVATDSGQKQIAGKATKSHVKFAIGVISTIAIVLSAFRFETLDTNDDDYFVTTNTNRMAIIDKKILDAMSKFDHNLRHLQMKGKETSARHNDCSRLLPDFYDAINAATKINNEFRKLLSSYKQQSSLMMDDKSKSSSSKKQQERRGLRKNSKTISYSIQIGSKIYVMSFYWPRLIEAFFGTDID
ncbi:hypothetical protein BLA29_001698 [Euroglyphus maynei]|uniref:Uncharacterized protein n=1 Tax=Euroglyphus maynei TaxID=6958 RepID=A0A1Y3BDV8_EURMA|nr:hypothetical protein BLA29_001698 [Euroglyphus maynei]